MICTALKPATVLTGFALVSSSVLLVDSFVPLSVTTQASSGPSVTTYATGLTNPRGLTFGPDGSLYVVEAGTGGDQRPGDIDPACPVDVNIYSPFTAGYSGRFDVSLFVVRPPLLVSARNRRQTDVRPTEQGGGSREARRGCCGGGPVALRRSVDD